MVGSSLLAAFIPIIVCDFHKELPQRPSAPVPHLCFGVIYGIGSPNTAAAR